jgi:cysteine-rich repeat protein
MLRGAAQGASNQGVCLAIGCGNSVLEPGEACDDGNSIGGDGCSARCDSDERCGNGFLDPVFGEGCDCGDASATTRPPGCSGPNSDADGATCLSNCTIRGCGDGVAGGPEDCDLTDLQGKTCEDLGFYSGTLACAQVCRFDTSACVGRCGDGVLDTGKGEHCDGVALDSLDCTDFGFYNAAGLACSPACGFDVSGCTGQCGDNIVNGVESCEPGMLGGLDCTDFGFYAASGLACTNACGYDTSACQGRCGDGAVDAPDEVCEAGQLGGKTCLDFGFYDAAGLACAGCLYDTRGCSWRCGDGIVNGSEQCEPGMLGGKSCTDFGYYVGAGLACTTACAYDTTTCQQKCGDGTINGGEQCDGSVPAGLDCLDYAYYTAAGLTCNAGCRIDTGGCQHRCGDGTVDVQQEECEPTVALTSDCTDFGYYQPNGLGCTLSCGLDTGACQQTCGDELLNGPEDCDGGPPPGEACFYAGYDAGLLTCSAGCAQTESRCRNVGWESMYPGVAGAGVTDVWTDGAVSYAVGFNSVVLRSDGGGWSPVAFPFSGLNLTGIWGANANDFWLVGWWSSPSTIVHYKDGTWTKMSGVPVAHFYGVWGTSANDVFFVGEKVMHWNGSALSEQIVPGAPVLRGVWGTASNNVFAVGDSGVIVRSTTPGTWTTMTSGTTSSLESVWGRSATEVYAVGASGTIRSFNGSGSWSTVTHTCGTVSLLGVWGEPNGRMLVSGDQGTLCQLAGGRWFDIDPPTTTVLRGIYGGPDGTTYVAGVNTILRSRGAVWIPAASYTAGPAGLGIARALWGTGPNDVYALGSGVGVQRYNGLAWSSTSSSSLYNDIWGTGGTVFAVGGSIADTNAIAGRFNGASWTPWTLTTTPDLNGVWGTSAANVYAVGGGGTIVQFDGVNTWNKLTSNTTADLFAVWGTASNNIYAVGSGTIMRFQSSWQEVATVPGVVLRDIWGASANDIWAVGDATIMHWDGSTWRAMNAGVPGIQLSTVWGTSGEVLASGANNLVHYVGGRWLPVRTPNNFVAQAAWGTGDLTLLLGGDDGAVRSLLALAGRVYRDAAIETACNDGWDDDGNDLVDCADPSCDSDAYCVGGGSCRQAIDISCSTANLAGTTLGGALKRTQYACAARDESGREQYYRFTKATAGQATVRITGFSGDLDLMVVGARGQACIPDAQCTGSSQTAASTEQVIFNATANTPYYVIVDGTAGAASNFQITVTCP